MKKSFSKFISCLLAAVMMLGVLPLGGVNASAYYYDGPYQYGFAHFGCDCAVIIDFDELYEGDVEIPSTLGGLPVKVIDSSAFSHCENITSVIIPDSVTSIGVYAFEDCYGLKSVTIPSSVRTVGQRTFNNCISLESVTIPDSVTYIDEGAFANCSSLESITIPSSVTYIRSDTFHNCTGLESITIPSSVRTIESHAFSGCTSLKSITIPGSVKTIDEYVFFGCSSLESVTISNGVTSIGQRAFVDCENLKNIKIPNSVISIGWYAFGFNYDNDYGNNMTKIPDFSIKGYPGTAAESYANNNGFEFVSLIGSEHEHSFDEGTVTIQPICDNVGEKVFTCTQCDYCYIEEVPELGHDIVENVFKEPTCTAEGESAFICSKCNYSYPIWTSALGHDFTESVTKEPTCTERGEKTFTCSRCDYSYTETIPSLGHDITESVTKEPTCTESGEKVLICTRCDYSDTVVIPATGHTDANNDKICDICGADFIEIVDSGKCGDNITWTLDKDGLLTISGTGKMYDYDVDASIFSNNKVKQVVIRNGVTRIGRCAFEGCGDLESVAIPDSVTSIGTWAFAYCRKLTDITIPYGITNISKNEFYLCTSLKNIEIPNSVTRIDDYAFDSCISLESVTIPNSVRSIHANAFSGCSSLTSIEIPDSVIGISDEAFYHCKNLKSVTIPKSVVRIGEYAFGFVSEQDDENGKLSDFIIRGYNGTAAEVYAKENCFNFISLDGHTHEYAESITSEPTCTENGVKTFICSCGERYTETIPATGHTDSDKNGICDTCGEKFGEPTNPSTNCSCMCHKTGFMGFIYKIARFLWKLFKTHRVCDCGAVHY